MEKLNRGDKIYLDTDETKESEINHFLDCRDGIVEVYEYNDCSGYGAKTIIKHQCELCNWTDYPINHTRVQHLDREDIESLGFDYDGQVETDNKNWVTLYSLYINHTENKEKYYNLFIDEGILNIVFCEYRNSVGRTEQTKFQGSIKNKSELKKVLEMIGVDLSIITCNEC